MTVRALGLEGRVGSGACEACSVEREQAAARKRGEGVWCVRFDRQTVRPYIARDNAQREDLSECWSLCVGSLCAKIYSRKDTVCASSSLSACRRLRVRGKTPRTESE